MIINKKEYFSLFSLFSLSTIVHFYTSLGMTGATITDENGYNQIAYTIYSSHKLITSQYNPLYPFFISLFHYFTNLNNLHEYIKLFNIIFFSSIIFPTYLLMKNFVNKYDSFLIATALVFMPWSSIVPMIWAESIFYALIIWSFYYLYNFLSNKSIINALLLGFTLGLAFLTKQSAILLAIAYFIGILYDFFHSKNNRFFYKSYITGISSFLLLTIPLIIYNIYVSDTGAFGYKASVDSYQLTDLFNFKFYISFFYQISYIILSTYIIYFILFFNSLFQWKTHDYKYKILLITILSYFFLITILCTLHRYNSVPDHYFYTMPYGRYLAPLVIFIFLIGFIELINNLRSNLKYIIYLSIPILIILIIFPPLNSLTSYGFLNNFDISFLNYFSTTGIEWKTFRHNNTLSIESIIALYCIFICIFILSLKLKLTRYFLFLTILILILSGQIAKNNILKLANPLSEINLFFKELHIKYKSTDITVDRELKSRQFDFLYQFHFYRKPIYTYPENLTNKIVYDFGTPTSPIEEYAYPVQAPWIGYAQFNNNKGWGFKELFDISGFHGISKNDDWIAGGKSKKFILRLTPQEHTIVFYTGCQKSQKNIGFNIYHDTKLISSVNNKDEIIKYTINNTTSKYQDYEFNFLPKQDKAWCINKIEHSSKVFFSKKSIIISKKNIPFLEIIKDGKMRIYK